MFMVRQGIIVIDAEFIIIKIKRVNDLLLYFNAD